MFKLSAVLLALAALPVHALTVTNLSGSGPTGSSFLGTVTFDDTLTSGELTVTLTNTTSAAVGGFLTAYAFDITGTGTLVSSTLSSFNTQLTNVSVAPFGTRDLGATSTGTDWLGGGSPSGGLPVGGTATWVFDLSAGATYDGNFIARFRGLNDGGSDKVPGVPVVPGIPEPETYALMLAGLGIIGFMARRRRT